MKKIGNKNDLLWYILFGCSVCAAIFFKIGSAFSGESIRSFSANISRVDYACVASAAVAFDNSETNQHVFLEFKMEDEKIAAKTRCQLPLVPKFKNSQILVSATSFNTGYGGMLSRFDLPKEDAEQVVEVELLKNGWMETKASKDYKEYSKGSLLKYYSRPGAWLVVAVVNSKNNENHKSTVFMGGQWRPEIMERM